MPPNDFENLGFEINVDEKSYNSAITRLNEIIKRLERIQKLEGASGKGGSSSKKGLTKDFEQWSKSAELSKRTSRRNIQQGNLNEYRVAQKNLQVQTQLGHAYYEQDRKIYLLNQNKKKLIDERLKQELGLVNKNTQGWSKYLAKITSVVVVARKLAHFIGSAIKESANYIENLNLFAVAYGDTYKQQLDWALGIAEAYGLANNEVIKFAGTFRELSTSLGLVGETADLVSQTVTNLGYDLSALFNTTVEQAMEKLQSGVFSGNVRPLRAYGIDISQNQIDALFETNEALRQLGVNARNLSQSDKVLARLIITLQSGKDSFGTMAREINNLQSQFRIFQGSLSNFKLAIGDLVEQPLSKVMVLANAVVIALTNIIRVFAPLEKEDKTPKFTSITQGAENANEELDKLEGKLAGFDKFNVLQQGNSSNVSVTEELNKLLEQQASIYENELQASLKAMNNEAIELAKNIEDIVAVGGTLLTIFAVSNFVNFYSSIKMISEGFALLVGSTTKLNKGLSLTNTLLITGLVYAIYKAVEAFRNGDEVAGLFAVTMGVTLVGAMVAFNWEIVKTIGLKLAGWFNKAAEAAVYATWKWVLSTKTLEKQAITAKQVGVALGAMVGAYFLADSILNLFGGNSRKVASGLMVLVGVIMSVTAAIVAMNTAISWGTMLPVLLAGVGTAIAGVKGLIIDVKDIQGFANGGYTNANLIMTHENGKREWVGKAAGSSAIVNDTQMSDIMEVAVAKGVFSAMRANSAMGSTHTSEQPIIIKIGEEEVFSVVKRTAKRHGEDFAKV